MTVLMIILAVALISVLVRAQLIYSRPTTGRLDGQEAESHILVSNIAMSQVSWRIHHFLPIFNFGPQYNKYIDELPGAASPDRLGNYYYTSSPPLAFVLPYLVSLPTGGPTLVSQRWFNVTLQLLAALALALLVHRCTRSLTLEPGVQALSAGSAAAVYLTAPECLRSHAFSLWGQQVYAVIMLVQLYLFVFRPHYGLMALLAIFGCLLDWTPYVANSGMAGMALLSYGRNRNRKALMVAAALIVGTIIGGLLLIFWETSIITLGEYIANLRARSSVRAVGGWMNTLRMLPYYINSLGSFTIIALASLWWRPWRVPPRLAEAEARIIFPQVSPLILVICAVAFALLEHVLVKDHALVYSFDRLKGVQLLALLVAWAAFAGARRAAIIFGGCLAAGAVSLGFFWFSYATPSGFAYIRQTPQEKIALIMRQTESTNGPSFFNREVRGAEVYYAGRNIFEHVDSAANKDGMTTFDFAAKWCRDHHFSEGTVYQLSGSYPKTIADELPRSLHVTRVFADQAPKEVGLYHLAENADEYHNNSIFLGYEPLRKRREPVAPAPK